MIDKSCENITNQRKKICCVFRGKRLSSNRKLNPVEPAAPNRHISAYIISTYRPLVPYSRVGWSFRSFQKAFWRNHRNPLCDWLDPTYVAMWHTGLFVDIETIGHKSKVYKAMTEFESCVGASMILQLKGPQVLLQPMLLSSPDSCTVISN